MSTSELLEVFGEEFSSSTEQILRPFKAFTSFVEVRVKPFNEERVSKLKDVIENADKGIRLPAVSSNGTKKLVFMQTSLVFSGDLTSTGVLSVRGEFNGEETWAIVHKSGKVFIGVHDTPTL